MKPTDKRIDELVTEITEKLWYDLSLNDSRSIRSDKVTTFLIRQIAELKATNEIIQEKLRE